MDVTHPGSTPIPGQTFALIQGILARYRRVAMVGLSANPNRPSFFAATYLRDYGYEILPVNPAYSEVMGLRCYPSLADVPPPLEVVDIFRRAEEVPALVEEAIRLGAKVIWMQLGVVHVEAAERAKAAGLEVVMDRCMKIEHARYQGGLGFSGIRTGLISSKKPKVKLKL
ncbi:MAG: CoA-binding protein [Candidatus Lambdaproteobacteria bacterium]|nr:CoA-binding protein [Candidatus Lambdaproteobacteria bacterium]